ncbi:response regulator [Silanimonas sp.]|jgi:twitching motility two-component system response regulator PilG|uniref:response regulator n=1 Tax=Silanimonas sp. TaxID=1929290 RepID=UPI0037C9D1ED
MAFSVLLVGMTARDDRMVEIVLTRAPNAKHRYTVLRDVPASHADIVIVDIDSPAGVEALAEARASSNAMVVCLSDSGQSGEGPYRIDRRSLLLRLLRLLDEAIAAAFNGNRRTAPANASTSPPATLAAVPVTPAAAPEVREPSVFAAAEDVVPSGARDYRPLQALVVDDSATVRTQLRDALAQIGMVTEVADSAAAALALLEQGRFDLALLDVVMPGADGYELCRTIKHNPYTRGIPVVMLTSRSSPFDRARGALAGCDSYLTKPVSAQAFFAAVDKQLRRHFRENYELLHARGYRAHA